MVDLIRELKFSLFFWAKRMKCNDIHDLYTGAWVRTNENSNACLASWTCLNVERGKESSLTEDNNHELCERPAETLLICWLVCSNNLSLTPSIGLTAVFPLAYIEPRFVSLRRRGQAAKQDEKRKAFSRTKRWKRKNECSEDRQSNQICIASGIRHPSSSSQTVKPGNIIGFVSQRNVQ